MSKIIECKNLIKIYNPKFDDIRALNDVSFSIEKGEYVSIMGKSGSGKSTLLNILGLLDKSTYGEYYLNGKLVNSISEKEATKLRLHTFGFIFQSFNLMNNISCLTNIELPMLYSGINKKERRERALDLMNKLDIIDHAGKKPLTLSGGQRQRVAIARALVNKPEIIFADEPTGALDSKTTSDILNLLSELNREGNTIIVVTHDSYVSESANRRITLKDGKIESDILLR